MSNSNRTNPDKRKFSSGERLAVSILIFFTILIFGAIAMLLAGKMVLPF